MLADFSTKAANFIYVLIIANSLPVEQFGIYSYIIAFVELFSVLFDLGLNLGVIKQIASKTTTQFEFIKKAIILKLSSASIAFILILSISYILSNEKSTLFLLIIYIPGFTLRSLNMFFQSLAIAREKMKGMAVIKIVDNIALLSGLFIISFVSPSLENYVIYIAAEAGFISLIWLYVIYFSGKLKVSGKRETISIKDIVILSSPFFLLALFTNIYFRIDITMLKYMRGDEAVAFYNSGYKLFVVLLAVPWVINKVFLPRLIKDDSPKGDFIHRSFPIYVGLALILIPFLCVAVTIYSADILHILFGKRYIQGTGPLSIVIWSLPFCTLAAYLNNLLVMRSPKTLTLIAGLILVPMNIILNIPLISKYGASGAAASTVLTEAVGSLAGYLSCRKLGIYLPFPYRRSLIYIFIALIIVIIAMLKLNNILSIFPAFILYILIISFSSELRGLVRKVF